MGAKLSVNLNAVAMLRNRRDLPWPSVTGLGRIALQAGAHGLTIHPRPDQRHIRFSDVPQIRALIDDEFPDAEFNIEGYPTQEFLQLVEKFQPEQVTLVPDDPAQATSDHGWDFITHQTLLRATVQRLRQQNMRVSLFCDPDAGREQIGAATNTGAHRIELYTGPFGSCYDCADKQGVEIAKLQNTAQLAKAAGLGVNAGHDLTVENLKPLAKALENLDEVSIGHGLIGDALTHGMAATVARFLKSLEE